MLIRTLRMFLAPYRRLLLLGIGLSLIGTLAALYLPSLNASIIDAGVARGNTGFIWRTGGVMLAVSALQGVCAATSVFFGARAAMAFGRDLRAALFGKVLAFSSRELNGLGAPSLITRNTNDVLQVQMLVMMSCTMLVSAPITMIGGVFMAIREDAGLSWLLLAAVPALALAIGFLVMRMRPLFGVMQERIDAVNRVLREQITGIRVVRAFVHSLPRGYDTVIDEEGSNISAGEKQLLTIARAFLADPALLILDEATSSVDTRTEVLVQHAMAALRSDRTSFVIAHRLSTIRDADVILVMEDGAIVEQGSHAALLARHGRYYALYNSQFAEALDQV